MSYTQREVLGGDVEKLKQGYMVNACVNGVCVALALGIPFGIYTFNNPDLVNNKSVHCYANATS